MKKICLFPIVTLWLSVFMLSGLPLRGLSPLPENQKPNVLFIMVDDLNNLFHYEGQGAITPNLDELASRGVKFDRAYCQVSLCNPSRASLMTGRSPYELGIWTNEPHFRGIYPRIVTLPQHFKEHNYHSVGIGKIYHNWGQPIHGDPDSWSEEQQMHFAAHYHDWYQPGRKYELHFDLKKGPAVQREEVPDEAYLDGRIANAAINRLRELQEHPFFLAVGFWKPHLPYNAPAKYWDMYDRENLPPVHYPEPVAGVPDMAYVHSSEARSYTDVDQEGPIPPEQKAELRHGYLASITYMDAQVGKLIHELDRLGLSERTIIVFVSDHGYHAGEHGQFGKWTNFEIGARVPLIIAAPTFGPAGVTSTSLVELVDLYPTLTDLCGLPRPGGRHRLSGVSLLSVLKDPERQVRTEAITQTTRPLKAGSQFTSMGTSVRTEDFRYTQWTRRSDGAILAEELYHLSEDPLKVDNLAGEPVMKKKLKEMREKLAHLQEDWLY